MQQDSIAHDMPLSIPADDNTSMRASDMRRHADDAAVLLRSLGNPQRLLILCYLVEGEHSVGELLARLDISQSSLSQHLAVLREAGMVAGRRDGLNVHYSLNEGPARELLATLHRIYCKEES